MKTSRFSRTSFKSWCFQRKHDYLKKLLSFRKSGTLRKILKSQTPQHLLFTFFCFPVPKNHLSFPTMFANSISVLKVQKYFCRYYRKKYDSSGKRKVDFFPLQVSFLCLSDSLPPDEWLRGKREGGGKGRGGFFSEVDFPPQQTRFFREERKIVSVSRL